MRVLSFILAACSLAAPAPAPAVVEKPQIAGSFDVLLDIDQPREPKPGGAWTEQVYTGPKQYDKVFVTVEHDTAGHLPVLPRGPMAEIQRVEVFGDAKLLAKIPFAQLGYTAQHYSKFAHDRGTEMGTTEKVKIQLGAAVGAYFQSAHPWHLVVRARNAKGALLFEQVFDGDEASPYSAITPPRPY